MSLFAYICTRTTNDPYIPAGTPEIRMLAREVSDAFVALSGGHQTVGEIKFFPLQRSVPNHLLCDGKEISKISFPQLYGFLGDTQGTPADAANFLLPNYIGTASFTPAATSEPETVNSGTAEAPTQTDPSTPAWDEEIYRQWDSGGRSPYFMPSI